MEVLDDRYPLISTYPSIQLRYEMMREDGESHKMAEMLAHQQGPGLNTDDVFFSGHCNGNQFAGRHEHIGDFYRKKAMEHGQDVTGKVYLSSLAAFPGDPQAWVSSRAEVKKLVSDRNWTVEGDVTHHSNRDNDCGQQYNVNGVAEDILDQHVAKDLAENPEIAPTPKEKLEYREKVRERISPPKVT